MNKKTLNKYHYFRKVFTLIELLVVISIIGILATLLMPSLQKAREKTKAAVCKSQQKQIYIGMVLYSDVNSEYLPFVRVDSPNAHSKPWHWSIAPYLEVDREENNEQREIIVNLEYNVFKCPSNDSITNYGSEANFTGYSMPYWAGNGFQQLSDSRFDPVLIPNVSSPTDALLLGESPSYYFNGGYTFSSYYYHITKWNRLFVDGSVNEGFQTLGFREVQGIAYYWKRWSFDKGY